MNTAFGCYARVPPSVRGVRWAFLTWLLGSDDGLDHGGDDVPQLVRGAENTPAVTLVADLLVGLLLNHLFDAADTQGA
ncbi:hypothetical protein EYF80_046251 [Liparis tanakae]|uniref:Uncharacterized protein n=1 Tax=Liparis tanakae TaxID=230148 RepID=A0A4Z2FQV3_9TELE|nr:hypothetical protein EYF80_046251 [Liparis tanakae]